ncbi:hypothetical protein COEREDRAFT_86753 [Coemansia reversa NRRL 1564]|uniref:ditrans,polycis-polyprenyl diphosphate synthase [(2E,6E)-farnesyldiphosphate specific] n=1 Tax=Coemansia reversa (strain ATCC 12441 / NRRL 1564) TaxID=763665 RepID=A0A2G5BCC4_COERN|nr:hypothetical protein COEREDRAFT_86753 [Coemansia reversa NRRL 1564]|eukprot:PIA16665.1 hypothetical protein COEREDRAFT_86753 [Coemansia reversa NRRL 1564]
MGAGMQTLACVVLTLLLAAVARVGSASNSNSDGRNKRDMKQQLFDGACTLALRSAHLVFAIHHSFQKWVQCSLTQAGLDVQELLDANDTDAIMERRQRLSDCLASLPQRPEHLAVILPEARVRECQGMQRLLTSCVDDVEALCAWTLLARVPRLSIYTRDDSAGALFDSIASRLRNSKMAARAFNGRTPDICLGSKNRTEHLRADADAPVPPGYRPDIHISLWSREHGYPSLVKVSQELAHKVQCNMLSSSDITENLVADYLRDSAGHRHPELLLLCDELAHIPEFPPWQLQDVELVQADSSSSGIGDAVCTALASYAKIEKRWGK